MVNELYYTVKSVLTFESADEIRKCDHSNEVTAILFQWCCLLCCTCKLALTFESVDENLNCDHSNESY